MTQNLPGSSKVLPGQNSSALHHPGIPHIYKRRRRNFCQTVTLPSPSPFEYIPGDDVHPVNSRSLDEHAHVDQNSSSRSRVRCTRSGITTHTWWWCGVTTMTTTTRRRRLFFSTVGVTDLHHHDPLHEQLGSGLWRSCRLTRATRKSTPGRRDRDDYSPFAGDQETDTHTHTATHPHIYERERERREKSGRFAHTSGAASVLGRSVFRYTFNLASCETIKIKFFNYSEQNYCYPCGFFYLKILEKLTSETACLKSDIGSLKLN